MVTSEVVEYIKSQLATGLNAETIRATLLSQKWNELDINEAFSQASAIKVSSPTPNIDTRVTPVVPTMSSANKYLIIGFIVSIAGNAIKAIYHQPSPLFFVGYLVFLIGYVAFIYGCVIYAKAKGYNWAFGLLGLLNFIGLIILMVLPNKLKA